MPTLQPARNLPRPMIFSGTPVLPSRPAPVKPVSAPDTFERAKPDIGWMTRTGKPPVNVNVSFHQLYREAAQGTLRMPQEASKHVYLTVPGLFSDRLLGYMNDNERGLRKAGLDVKRVGVDADGSVEKNARTVRDAILAAARDGRQVVLMGHSKGGVEIAAALALYPELRPHVRAVVTMQAPLGGSPIADEIAASPALSRISAGVVKLFGGDPRSVTDLTFESQKRLFTAHPYPQDIPTVCLASYSSNPLTPLAAPTAYMKSRYGELNDGLVCAKDALLPGSRSVLIEGLDHGCMVLKGIPGFSTLEPAQSAQALVALALAQRG